MKPHTLARLGATAGLNWYNASTPAIYQVGHGNINLGAALLAATSPRCRLLDNMRRALRRHSPLPCHAANLTRALAGETLRGPKVSAFAAALAGDSDAVTIDIWLCRAFNESDNPTLGQYRALSKRITRAARRAGHTPRDYAAMIWCGMLSSSNREALNYGEIYARLTAQTHLPTLF